MTNRVTYVFQTPIRNATIRSNTILTKYTTNVSLPSDTEETIPINVSNTIDYNAWFYPKLTVCIGVQKSGTTSLIEEIQQIHHFHVPQREIHHFDWSLIDAVDGHELDSFQNAVQSVYNNYNNVSVAKYIHLIKYDAENAKKLYYFTKTPDYNIYPHIAHIISNQMVRFGTKILLLLRDPMKRFISGYFHEKVVMQYFVDSTFWPNNGIDGYLDTTYDMKFHGNNSFAAFNAYLKRSYYEYKNTTDDINKKAIIKAIMNRWNEFVYFYTNRYLYLNPHNFHKGWGWNAYFFIWIRSCYFPQILPWIHYINDLERNDDSVGRYKHQFKVVQSEQLFQKSTFKKTIQSVICYIKYNMNNDKYTDFMKECVSKKQQNMKRIWTNAQAKPHNVTMTTEHSEALSFEFSNKWLKILFEEYPTLLLGDFNWNLWNNIEHL